MRKWATVAVLLLAGWGTAAPGADFDGDGKDDIAVFRPSTGRWSVRGLTRPYFGGPGDIPVPLDTNGDGTDECAVFKPVTGRWAVRGRTRAYYGSEGDVPIGKGGYNPYAGQFDYVVRPGDGADLERALESGDYVSVFVPAGEYSAPESLTVTQVKRIAGEAPNSVLIYMPGNSYLAVSSPGCLVENLTVLNGGFTNIGNFFIGAANVTVRDCQSRYSSTDGFLYTSGASGVTLDNCKVDYSGNRGFRGSASVKDSKLMNCSVTDTNPTYDDYGFEYCNNLINCYVKGEDYGYSYCNNIVSSTAFDCRTMGFSHCTRLSSCHVDGNGTTLYGMQYCNNLAATTVEGWVVDDYQICNHFSTQTWGSCN